MPESLIVVNTKNAHTWNRTIGANSIEDEYVLQGEQPLPSYTIQASTISIATANDHVLEIMAGASLNVRIRSILIEQVVNATAAALVSFALFRLTTAGTGGTAVTPGKHDTADAASGATAMTLPTVKGTETTEIRRSTRIMRQAFLTTAAQADNPILWTPGATNPAGIKAWIIPAGVANGLAIKVLNACAGATVNVTVEIVETSFL